MKNQMINSFSFDDIITGLTGMFNSVAENFENFLFTSDKIHIMALTLTALVLVSVFFVLMYMVMKFFSFVSGGNHKEKSKPKDTSEVVEKIEETADNDEEEVSENTGNSQASAGLNESLENDRPIERDKHDEVKEKIIVDNTDNYEDDYLVPPPRKKESSLIELDWKKSKFAHKLESATAEFSQTSLTLSRDLNDLLGMIVNMLGRKIDELKIAQAVMFRSKNNLSEETILQIVLSIKEFLNLCQRGAFDNARRLKDLPDEEESIVHLIAGDTSYAMALLEALMDEKINQAINMKNMVQRDALFKATSNYACYFGTLAEINDLNLASTSFELAIEMDPDNTLAWSRCADLYKQIGFEDKANWAYRNVLKTAKNERFLPQEANARKVLSQYLYAQGDGGQASELYLQSKTFYDSIGINRPLDRKELEIIKLIDSTSTDKIVRSVLPHHHNSL